MKVDGEREYWDFAVTSTIIECSSVLYSSVQFTAKSLLGGERQEGRTRE